MKNYLKLVMTVVILASMMAVLSACDHTPKPGDRFQEYVSLWKKQDFKKMYAYLSADAKKKISEKKFVSRYKDIYSGIETSDLKVTYSKPKDDPKPDKNGDVHLSFKVSMKTLAGPVSFNEKAVMNKEKVKDKKNWFVNWTPAMIFPKLQSGDKVRVDTTPSERGEIVDRNQKGLAMNGVAAQIGVVPGKLGSSPDSVKSKLASLLGISTSDIDAKMKQSWVKADSFVPVKTIDASQVNLIDKLSALQGVMEQDKEARVYPCQEACAHLTGYVGPITSEQLKKDKGKGYNSHSVVGRKGLELVLEDQLRGIDGAKIYIEKKDGEEGATIAERKPKNGKDFQLAIDTAVQKSLYKQMKNDPGAASAIDPKTGDVLALVSTPSFNPNEFSLGVSGDQYKALSDNPDKPLLNRFSATFTSGSTFKPITAAIALDEGVITPDTTMTIEGKKWQKDKSWGDFYVTRLDSPQKINLQDALVRSDNIFFARTAVKIGGKAFESHAKKMGFGESLPIEYPMQKSILTNKGSLADDEILLANTGYGQGENNVNPLFFNLVYSSFVNDGSMIQPHLVMSDSGKATFWKKNVMTAKTANIIKNDLVQVVEKPYGTAKDAKVPGLKIAAKTGTAEFKAQQGTKGKEDGWVVAFNTEDPKLMVSVVIQNAQDKGGSHYVAPMIKNVFKDYFHK